MCVCGVIRLTCVNRVPADINAVYVVHGAFIVVVVVVIAVFGFVHMYAVTHSLSLDEQIRAESR